MDERYTILDVEISPLIPWREVLIAELMELGFDSFEETPKGCKGYILEDQFDESAVRETTVFSIPDVQVSIQTSSLEQRNWNQQWEESYSPLVVEGILTIRAPFHEPLENGLPEVIIQPQMSFGTGHHPTTYLMVEAVHNEALEGRSVLDMGTGTGILGILARRAGAAKVFAIDNDPWSVENTAQNAALNQCDGINVRLGDVEQFEGEEFDVIFANINRNILIRQMPFYNKALSSSGTVYLSGFYEGDVGQLRRAAEDLGWTLDEQKTRETWCLLKFKKA